jgi:hypothetical protein
MSYAASLFLTLYNTFPIKTICPKGPIFLNGHSDHFRQFLLYTCTKRAEGKFCKSENKINKKLILNILNFFSSIKLCHLCTPNFQPWAFFSSLDSITKCEIYGLMCTQSGFVADTQRGQPKRGQGQTSRM